VAGRNQSVGLCPSCGAGIQAGVAFCPRCGQALGSSAEGGSALPPQPVPKAGRGALIAFLVCIALLIVGSLGSVAFGLIMFRSNVHSGVSNSMSIGSVENNLGPQWHLTFFSLDGTKESNQLVVKQDMTVVAENKIGARTGDIVLVESDNAGILGAAVAVYIVPFFLFFLGYFAGSVLGFGEGVCAAIAVAGFVLGIMIARKVDQYMRKKGTLRFTITEIRKSCSDM
jgi:sigma-E factor negative regulatory protein RseC